MVYPKKCVVIDIGNEQIKIADLQKNRTSTKINQFIIIKTPEDCISDGVIIDKVKLNNAITVALKENKIKNKNIVFTITSTKIITREVEFPDMKPKKLKAVILNSASEYFPVNLNEYILDYVINDTVLINGEKIIKINLIAALSNLVEEYVALADLMDVKLVGVDYTGNSLTNFLKRENLEECSMVLNIGSESTMVSIMVNGVSKFNRNIMFGTGILLEHVKKHFEVDIDEAIRISKERQLLSIEQDNNPYLSNDISSAMNQILNGVSRLADYYASRNKEKITHIYIVGGGSNIYGIEDFVEKYFNLPTSKLKNFKSATYKGQLDFTEFEQYFANVIGACFSEINLLPRELAEKEKINSRKRTAFLLVILVAVSLIASYIMEQNQISSIKYKKEQLEKDISSAQAVQEIKEQYRAINKRVEFRQSVLDNSASSSEKFVSILEEMENKMPSDVFYINITDSGESLQINCVAKDQMTVAKFIEALKNMGFSEVYVPSLTQINSSSEDETVGRDVSFTVTCKY